MNSSPDRSFTAKNIKESNIVCVSLSISRFKNETGAARQAAPVSHGFMCQNGGGKQQTYQSAQAG